MADEEAQRQFRQNLEDLRAEYLKENNNDDVDNWVLNGEPDNNEQDEDEDKDYPYPNDINPMTGRTYAESYGSYD